MPRRNQREQIPEPEQREEIHESATGPETEPIIEAPAEEAAAPAPTEEPLEEAPHLEVLPEPVTEPQNQSEEIHESATGPETEPVIEAPEEETAAPAPAEEPLEEAPRPDVLPEPLSEPQNQPAVMLVTIKEGDPENDILATADVEIEGLGTLRNVRIKNGDYGPRVTMPMTRMPVSGRWRDVFYFETPALRERFDAAVMGAYRQTMGLEQAAPENTEIQEPEQEHGGMGMSM